MRDGEQVGGSLWAIPVWLVGDLIGLGGATGSCVRAWARTSAGTTVATVQVLKRAGSAAPAMVRQRGACSHTYVEQECVQAQTYPWPLTPCAACSRFTRCPPPRSPFPPPGAQVAVLRQEQCGGALRQPGPHPAVLLLGHLLHPAGTPAAIPGGQGGQGAAGGGGGGEGGAAAGAAAAGGEGGERRAGVSAGGRGDVRGGAGNVRMER